ncbi:hypothetical protein ACFL5V_12695 [Fibrobacterota bacterium]
MEPKVQEQFLELLKNHRRTFSELRALQGRIEKTLKKMDLKEITSCREKEEVLSERLRSEKMDLGPFLEQWNKMSKELKSELLQGDLGKVLASIESIAEEINNSHQSMFGCDPDLQGAPESPPKQHSTISDIINLYR